MTGRAVHHADPLTPGAGRAERWAGRGVRFALDRFVRRHLRGVWVRGELPTGPAVWVTNHHSWWDYFAATSALRAAGRSDVGVLMLPGSIAHRRLYRWGGAVGTDRLRTAIEMVRAGMVVVVFPEGRLRPPGPTGPLAPGAQWLARATGSALTVVATRVLLRGQQLPEAYLDVHDGSDGTHLREALDAALADVDQLLATSAPEVPLPGFRSVLGGRRSWPERRRMAPPDLAARRQG